MSRRSDHAPALAAALLALAALLAPAARAQDDDADAPAALPAIEQYLADHNLRELLAAHLEERLRAADARERPELADRLGRLYVELMDAAPGPQARRVWEDRSVELLRLVPEADSFDLRINLIKARYLHAEDVAERHRLRMADPEEIAEAERILRSVGPQLQEIGTKIHQRVQSLERREESGRVEDTEALRLLLADARRLRSLAMYYAGWTSYYTAFLSRNTQPAGDALTQWGWLLNAAGGRQASVERLPHNLLRYEHVARAAIGCALAESLRGADDAALRWLDAIEGSTELPPAIRAQLPARRIAVLAAAKRWADLDVIVRRLRGAPAGEPPRPMPAGEARLLAVLALEAMNDPRAARFTKEAVQPLAAAALGDLIALGEVKHVVDLVHRYGTATLAGEGFIVQYVRGLESYEAAREAHRAGASNPDEPTADPAVANLYRDAAGSLRTSVESDDAAQFPEERTNAGLLLGLALYYADDLVAAADRLESVHASAAGPDQAQEALWLAIVALDRAAELRQPSLAPRRDRLATLYLNAYPRHERAARLLLRRASSGLISEEDAAQVLLAVPADSPLYEAARRHASGLLYGLFRKARSPDRDFAALRFATVAEEVLAFDRRTVNEASEEKAMEAAGAIVLRVRQILDAVLGMSAPDLERAAKALEILDATSAYAGLDLTDVEGEIAFRRFQIALARGDRADMQRRLDRLHALGGRFADAADRLLYRRALDAWSAARADTRAAAEVVAHGARIMTQFRADADALADPAVYNLHNTVADAAAAVWRASADQAMRDTALRIDRNLLDAGKPTGQVLRRYAELSEAAGDAPAALDAWRQLLAGLSAAAPEWYEARYHSLRLLAAADPARARQALDQHKVLHPDLGPDPWGPMLRDLDARIPPAPHPPAATPPATPGGAG